MSAIVVGENDILLSQKGLSSFVKGARNAGYPVQDPRVFEAAQKEALYRWVPSAPDSLDISDHELRELSQVVRGADTADTVRMQEKPDEMKRALRLAGRVRSYMKSLFKTFLIPIAIAVIAGLILMNWQDIWHIFKQL